MVQTHNYHSKQQTENHNIVNQEVNISNNIGDRQHEIYILGRTCARYGAWKNVTFGSNITGSGMKAQSWRSPDLVSSLFSKNPVVRNDLSENKTRMGQENFRQDFDITRICRNIANFRHTNYYNTNQAKQQQIPETIPQIKMMTNMQKHL